MTKPMYCPMSFMRIFDGLIEKRYNPMQCTPDCAWAVKFNGMYRCAIAQLTVGLGSPSINTRPLKGDDE